MFQRSLSVTFFSTRGGVSLLKAARIHTGCAALAKQPLLTLNNGKTAPAFGLGLWNIKPEDVSPAIQFAIKSGYRLFDSASLYKNEVEFGEALQKCFKDGLVKREDIFIITKLWNTDHDREDVVPACERSVKDLQLDYVDMFIIHYPFALKKGGVHYQYTEEEKLGYDPARMAKTWEGMEECVSRGLTKSIGISNFTIVKTETLLKTAKIAPVLNQVECHPYFQNEKLKQYCDSKGIIISAALPLGSPTRPDPIRHDTDQSVLEDPVIKDIALKHGVSTAQVCISYTVGRGIMVHPKSIFENELLENIQAATELKLDDEDVRRIRALNKDHDKRYRLMKGNPYWKKDQTYEDFWDVAEDEKFVIKQ